VFGLGVLAVVGVVVPFFLGRSDAPLPLALATLLMPVGGGTFRHILPLRQGALAGGAKVFPGGFVVALTGRAGNVKLPLQVQTISIPAPAEGVVRRAFRSTTRGGRGRERLPKGAPEAWANFRFEVQPRRTRTVSVRWFTPEGRLLGSVAKSNRPVVSSYLRLPSGLPSGRWVAQLRVGGKVVQTLSVPIG
jgi:hypothetical protein